MKACQRHRGAISVFMILILLPTILFSGLVTDAVRIFGSKSLISEAGELTMNASLAQYSAELKDAYGLMVMAQKPEEIESSLETYFMNTIHASGIEGAENVGTLLDLKASDFYVCGVDGSQIYQTEAEKQQILEYMKYRAPVCIGEELIEKLQQISGAKKMNEATMAQLDFAETMDDLQNDCENVKKAMDLYILLAEGDINLTHQYISGTVSAALSDISRAIPYCFAKAVMDKYRYEMPDEHDDAVDFMDSMHDYNQVAEVLYYECDGLTMNKIDYLEDYLACIYYEKNLPDDIESAFQERYDNADEADKERLLEEYNLYCKYEERVTDYYVWIWEYGRDIIIDAYDSFYICYSNVKAAQTASETAIEMLETLNDTLEKQRNAYATWKDKIDNLDEGAFKDGMKKDAEGYDNLLDEEAYQKLHGIMVKNRDILAEYTRTMEVFKYCDSPLYIKYDEYKLNYTDIAEKVGKFNFFPSSFAACSRELNDVALEFENVYYTGGTFSINEELFAVKFDPFYLEITEHCNKTGDEALSEAKKQETDGYLKDAIFDFDALDIKGVSNIWSEDTTLPTTLLNLGGTTPDDNYAPDTLGNTGRAGRKTAISNAKASLNATANFLDKLSELLEESLENLYLMEYGIQMFSYYTIDKDTEGKTISGDITSLSDDDLTDNALYKAEAEYMIWGVKGDAEENVRKTSMLIYGIRMMFNLFYTFTDPAVSASCLSMATAMSCGIAFLVPVFNIVLKISLAGLEAVMDLKDILAGKDVPLLKDAKNSIIPGILGLSGKGTSSHIITMNYKEYLECFLLLRTIGNAEGKTLARIADCIQLNTKMDITQGYTMVAIGADVETRTTFMRKISELPDAGIESVTSDWYTIPYKSVLGY